MNNWLLNLVQGTNYTDGHKIVSPSFHLNPELLSEEARESAHLFSSKMLTDRYHDDHPPIDIPDHYGSTEKLHFRVGGHTDEKGNPLPSSLFMVKPYYEDLAHVPEGYYPLSGWAEIAYAHLLNASGLGHLAMNVHAFPYMKSSLLAIDLAEGMHPIGSVVKGKPWRADAHWGAMGEVNFGPGIKDDAAKLGAVDFLLNNQDRNESNLLMHVDEGGSSAGILAIDNGRAMQYMRSNRIRAPFENIDNPLYYMTVPAFKNLVGHRDRGVGGKTFSDLGPSLKAVSSWWKANRNDFRAAFDVHARAIRYLPLLHHVRKSFADRADAMDTFADDIDKYGPKPYEEFLSGHADGSNKSIFHRASVKVRSWKPPQPEIVAPEYDDETDEAQNMGTAHCPQCGEEWKTDANHSH